MQFSNNGWADSSKYDAFTKKLGVLDKHNVEMIGASSEAIDMAEDRELF